MLPGIRTLLRAALASAAVCLGTAAQAQQPVNLPIGSFSHGSGWYV